MAQVVKYIQNKQRKELTETTWLSVVICIQVFSVHVLL